MQAQPFLSLLACQQFNQLLPPLPPLAFSVQHHPKLRSSTQSQEDSFQRNFSFSLSLFKTEIEASTVRCRRRSPHNWYRVGPGGQTGSQRPGRQRAPARPTMETGSAGSAAADRSRQTADCPYQVLRLICSLFPLSLFLFNVLNVLGLQTDYPWSVSSNYQETRLNGISLSYCPALTNCVKSLSDVGICSPWFYSTIHLTPLKKINLSTLQCSDSLIFFKCFQWKTKSINHTLTLLWAI